jgi:GNAT superfamily N-acetyltransferase
MTILALRDRPEFIAVLAEWQDREWRHLYRVWDRSMAVRQLELEPPDGRLPQTLLAMDGDRLLGSISAVFNDLPGWEKYNPWVASFFVIAEARGKGVGHRLLVAMEELLRAQNVRLAYLFTETAQAFFEKRGWSAFEPADANGHPVLIMTKEFSG